METAASSEQTTSPRDLAKRALLASGIANDYPEIGQIVLKWHEDGLDVDELTELKHNGAGKQVVLKYPPHIFMDALRLAIKTHSVRRTFDNREKSDIARVLMGTCLFNNNNLTTLLGVSRGTVVAWSPGRPEKFPMQRLGGELSAESLPLILSWWEDRMKAPNAQPNGWYLHRAFAEGATWPVIARFTGQTVQQAKKAANSTDKEKPVVVNISIEASHPGDSSRVAERSSEGHSPGSSEGRAEHDDADFEGESLLAPPSSAVGDDAAFAPAVYLVADDEADDGDAGHADAPEDGVSAGDAGAVGEGTGSPDRGVHPFLLS